MTSTFDWRPLRSVPLAPGWRQVVRRALGESALRLKEHEGLGGEREQSLQPELSRAGFHELHQLAPNPLVLVRGAHIEACELAIAGLGVHVECHARDRVAIDLEDVEIAERLLQAGAAAVHQLASLDTLAREHLDGVQVLLLRGPNLLVLVGVDQRADPVVREHLGQQPVVLTAVDDVDPLDSGSAGGRGVLGLRHALGQEIAAVLVQEHLEVVHAHLPDQLALHDQAILAGDVNELDGLQRVRQRCRRRVGVHAVGLAVAVEAKRRDNRNDALGQQRLKQPHVDALDLPGKPHVHALDDARRVCDDSVGRRRPEIVGRQPLEDFVREPGGGRQGELERRRVRRAGAIQVTRRNPLLRGEPRDLGASAVDERDADVQRPEHGHIEQDVGEVLVGDDGPVDGEDEGALAVVRDVVQDAAEVGWLHSEWRCRRVS